MPSGESLKKCEECNAVIPEARQKAVPGVRLCIGCQSELDKENKKSSGYNRRGSKDSQLR
jgi:RNA polymerase-binding transcription factor DksA